MKMIYIIENEQPDGYTISTAAFSKKEFAEDYLRSCGYVHNDAIDDWRSSSDGGICWITPLTLDSVPVERVKY